MPASLVWLAIGAFAIGTEGLMIAGLLPAIAADFHSSVATAGQLITIFALAYAVGSPILSALCGGLDRRRLLVAALLAFTVSNLLAAGAQSLWQLVAARVLLALSAVVWWLALHFRLPNADVERNIEATTAEAAEEEKELGAAV